ncbi:MAG: YicC family protein [Rhodobacteraceae bacterium]|nr:MAG: YicC family protein [Paracoccaceae bacterium]
MIRSMTGFASATGARAPFSWAWELRAVNARGLDLRLRVPDWIEGLEPGLRQLIAEVVQRGSVTLSLRLTRDEATTGAGLNRATLAAMLDAMAEIEQQAHDRGVALAPATAADILSLRGVLEEARPADETEGLAGLLLAEARALVADFQAMRTAEGRALQAVLQAQLTEIAALTDQAATLAEARRDSVADSLKAALARVMDVAEGADPQRVAQELALIAVKSDVTEEIDRLRAHVEAARALLTDKAPVGRKLDFLTQEFNREANTLCSKAGSTDLTAVGLALKAVIDQMREQVQNIE